MCLTLGNSVLNREFCYPGRKYDRESSYIFVVPKLHGICVALCESKPVTIWCPVVGAGGVELIDWYGSPEILITTD